MAAAILGVLGLSAAPAMAASGRPAGGGGGQWLRSNTAFTHSPQVLRELAGVHAAVITGPQSAATRGPIAGAPQGIDVSSHQESQRGGINWATIAGDGITFVAVKATEGAYYTNPYAPNDLTNAAKAGLKTVAYAFAIPNGGVNGTTHYSKSPVVQADDLVNYLTSKKVAVPPVMLDIENDPYSGSDGSTGSCYGLTKSAMVSWIAGFDAEIAARTGHLPFIYTNPTWWKTCTGASTAFGHTPLWAASWTTASQPALPAGWGTWNLWQYTSKGTVKGLSGSKDVDLDQLNPAIITLLPPGTQQDPAAAAVRPASAAPFRVKPLRTLTFAASGLPQGLSINGATGLISGTPLAPGSWQVRVTARDTAGRTGSATFGWVVTAPAP